MGRLLQEIKIYHIVHVDRLPSILADGGLFCDTEIVRTRRPGTNIGLDNIKQRRCTELSLNNYPDLFVGACVPFYFCPRSVMLYLIHKRNKELVFQGGQEQIIHLVADLYEAVNWANTNGLRWAFTTSNAGSYYFTDYNDLQDLNKINWNAVNARSWVNCKEDKQAEFLLERCFPWSLVGEIGVRSNCTGERVVAAFGSTQCPPIVRAVPEWYY